MMKHLFFAVLAFCSVSAYSQKWSYGVEAGFVHNSFRVPENKRPGITTSGKDGFKIGALVNYSLPLGFVLEGGLGYIRKGGELKGNNLIGVVENDIAPKGLKTEDMDYLNIPLSVGYKLRLNNSEFFLMPQIGWFFNYGLRGDGLFYAHNSAKDALTSGDYMTRVELFPSTKELKPAFHNFNRFDTGAVLGVSLLYKGARLKCTYELGTYTIHGSYGNVKNRTLVLSAAYLF